ncbi:radical SAM protein [Paenibacillus swuensis]|uniref:Radical SAM protein n=1 Tax=Paenibacillus swuensis TaxID=1178515 RepID=A0A172TIU1_9BACL|nr:radical SAM protein [Paenibacillus swuensis]ANE46975.1 radical SAM protein [Paenibacillus swuensis]
MAKLTRYESIQSKTMLNSVKATSMPFNYSLNPYRGCQHGCSFCYARSTHAFLGERTDDTFQHHIFLKNNAADALREQLVKASRSKQGLDRFGPVAIGTATDPYQQIESRAMLTRQCLEVLAEYEVPVSVTTRSPLILRDLELLKRMKVASINLSVHTVNTNVWRRFEPSTPSPAKRLDTVKTLVEEGLPAGIFMAPILPLITDTDNELDLFVRVAAASKASFVMPSFLRLNTSEVKYWFFETLRTHYPEFVTTYASYYHASHHLPDGYRLPMKKKVHTLLARYGLADKEPFIRPPENATPDLPEGPIQLSFTF